MEMNIHAYAVHIAQHRQDRHTSIGHWNQKFVQFKCPFEKLIYGYFSGKVNFPKRLNSLEEFYAFTHILTVRILAYEMWISRSHFYIYILTKLYVRTADAANMYVCVCFCN